MKHGAVSEETTVFPTQNSLNNWTEEQCCHQDRLTIFCNNDVNVYVVLFIANWRLHLNISGPRQQENVFLNVLSLLRIPVQYTHWTPCLRLW